MQESGCRRYTLAPSRDALRRRKRRRTFAAQTHSCPPTPLSIRQRHHATDRWLGHHTVVPEGCVMTESSTTTPTGVLFRSFILSHAMGPRAHVRDELRRAERQQPRTPQTHSSAPPPAHQAPQPHSSPTLPALTCADVRLAEGMRHTDCNNAHVRDELRRAERRRRAHVHCDGRLRPQVLRRQRPLLARQVRGRQHRLPLLRQLRVRQDPACATPV